ncbi:hypothetical protein [Alkaliphilus serpentinus]|uniref:DNA-binding protein n=1 Tax=Alkaliphilus serpentinus TaxID=1482731 RepID=A0A833HQN5_9FIRM|nr:hypothetical protein [Alkaliphilus serpentinus]KAB3532104.1 hypothetical protein F8153_03275 [Alkaliphilus serpentinus]
MGKEAKSIEVLGNLLKCQVCGHDQFWHRETLMNTAGASFLGFDWANKAADNYVCDQCGYVHWFLSK